MKLSNTLVIIISCFLLTGCLYPEEKLQKNTIPYNDQIQAVQTSIDQYQQDTSGLLPIKTRDMSTPIYQKYPIDFSALTPKYMAEPPGTAYETGGIFQYVLVDVEEDPTVKLIDLRMAEEIHELNVKLNVYRQANGYPPFKDVITDEIYSLDYEKLGYKEDPMVESPYSGEFLPLVIDKNAQIYVDYRIDLNNALKDHEHNFKQGDDIREILVMKYQFVPAYSLPYTIDEKGEPVFLTEDN
ncbi:hypothetical protein [Metabacillus halosaccharovorans]|uniref:ABC transporter periplasmic binding protein yphF n=1 Tax=Metabacillus halosaccharovorans TaxID=930124 RepID=A0ABT3DN80_9BACI|nr:hypothetical protein [Metabacillus halosaccharovorans]MCV9888338.1 hypothetical protein [Metabacillus halosaccharovorans]